MKVTVYKIDNDFNDMCYIGQTKDFGERYSQHFTPSRRSDGGFDSPLYVDMDKCGADRFSMTIIEEVDAEIGEEREQFWIRELNTLYPNGYNLTSGGELGKTYSDITKQRIGAKTKERWQDPEIAPKMLAGVLKAAAAAKIALTGIEKVPREMRTCPECGEEYRVMETSRQEYCSIGCVGRKHSHLGHQAQTANREVINKGIREYALEWTQNNSETVISCPLNKITTNLKPMLDGINQEFQVVDMRTISKAIAGKEGRKGMLKFLQDSVLE